MRPSAGQERNVAEHREGIGLIGVPFVAGDLEPLARKSAKTFTLCSLFEASEASCGAARSFSLNRNPSWFLVPKGPSKGIGGHDMSYVD